MRSFFRPWWWKQNVSLKHWFLQEPRGITSQKMSFFIVTAAKTSNSLLLTEPENSSPYLQSIPTVELYTLLKQIYLCRSTFCNIDFNITITTSK
jgi:hypothetical protein